jgi:hypothetical protein
MARVCVVGDVDDNEEMMVMMMRNTGFMFG